MKRILCLDVGDKNIGLAISDALGLTAQGLDTLRREDIEKDIKRITELIKEYNISELLVGLPIQMNGSSGARAEVTLKFIEVLKAATKINIKTQDERFSSKEAERVLLKNDVSRKKRKLVLDKLAAQIILQSYLDSQDV